MYQILSQLVRFCRLYIKKHFGVFFFGSQCISIIIKETVALHTCAGDNRGGRKPWHSLGWSEWWQRSRLKTGPTGWVQHTLDHDGSMHRHGSCQYAAAQWGTVLMTSSPCLQSPGYIIIIIIIIILWRLSSHTTISTSIHSASQCGKVVISNYNLTNGIPSFN